MMQDPPPGEAPSPLVEVLCLAGGAPGSLELFLQSWINQSAPNWRLTFWREGREEVRDPILEDYAAMDHRIRQRTAPVHRAGEGPGLREEALREATGEYVLLARVRDYYIPRFVEFTTGAIRGTAADVVLFDLIHGQGRENAGDPGQESYRLFRTEYKPSRLEIGAALVRTPLAREAAPRAASLDGTATFFSDLLRLRAGRLSVCKIPQVLLVLN